MGQQKEEDYSVDTEIVMADGKPIRLMGTITKTTRTYNEGRGWNSELVEEEIYDTFDHTIRNEAKVAQL